MPASYFGRPFTIRIAGNNWNPCLLALREKDYAIQFWFIKSGDNDYQKNIDAVKDGRLFSATTEVELLGLVAMWEVRGDDWQTKPGEPYVYDELYPASITYDHEGNVFEIGDEPPPAG
jgi:hypothetical protein